MTLHEAVRAYLAAHDRWRHNKDMSLELHTWTAMFAARERMREIERESRVG